MQIGKTTLGIIFVLFLFSLYTFSAMFLTITGGDVYKSNIVTSDTNYNMRTSTLYLTEKIRQNQIVDGVSVSAFNSEDALVLTQRIAGYVFETWVYIEDGYLCETLIQSGAEIFPGTGQKIMPLQNLELSIDDSINLIDITATDITGNTHNSKVYIECEISEGSI